MLTYLFLLSLTTVKSYLLKITHQLCFEHCNMICSTQITKICLQPALTYFWRSFRLMFLLLCFPACPCLYPYDAWKCLKCTTASTHKRFKAAEKSFMYLRADATRRHLYLCTGSCSAMFNRFSSRWGGRWCSHCQAPPISTNAVSN